MQYLKRIQETLLHILLAVVITTSVMTFPLDFVEAPLYDLRQSASMKPEADPNIVIITIDDQTLNRLNDISPLPVQYHLQAVEALEEQEVRAVGYLVDFNKVKRIDAEAFDSDSIQTFYRSTVRLNAQGTPFMLGIPFDLNGEVNAPYPLSQIPQSVAVVHRDGTIFGKDKITRRALLSLYDRLAFEMALATRIYPERTISNPPGSYGSSDADAQYFLLQYHQADGKVFDPDYDTFSYPRYSFVDLVEGKLPAGILKDKIVLIGTFLRDNPNDFTLISPDQGKTLTPKILVQANILDSILNGHGIVKIDNSILAIVCFFLSLLIILASFRVRPSKLILFTVALILATFSISFIVFQPIPTLGTTWIPLGAPLLSLTLSFYLMIPLRLYSEHRKRGELEQQNEVLRSVEEMKTNFLQLVTHDLKTPIAKIQGLTESLQRTLHEHLGPKELETMSHILAANEDLNHFINSLLELTKLDNQGIRVQLQSKDINSLLEAIIVKHRFTAQARKIHIETDFEPLFPIKFDVDLISKVLSNLIDNAIKYSPEDTAIKIKTLENGDWVHIKIQDQGIGIPESELQNLFQRFHRISNETTKTVKGTGLGLYLSKYFIEAHQGKIQVESTIESGTTFTISLKQSLSEKQVIQPGLKTQLKPNSTEDRNHA